MPSREPLYEVMQRCVDECLLKEGSLLEPGAEVWTEPNLTAMKQRFIDDPNEDPDDVADRFEEMAKATGDAYESPLEAPPAHETVRHAG